MSTETLFSIIISIIVGIVLSYWGIWYSKKLKDKQSLSLVNDEWISLLTTFQDKFDALKIEFTQPINTNLYYYRAIFLNTGTLDLDKSKMYAPLEITCPAHSKVNECKIGKQSSDRFTISSFASDNKIQFHWDLLKPQEYFSFECIIESTIPFNRTNFQKGISISQRIADLKDVQQINAWDMNETKRSSYIRQQIAPYGAILFFLLFIAWMLHDSITSFITPNLQIEYAVKHRLDNSPVAFKLLDKQTVELFHNKKIDTVSLSKAQNYIQVVPSIYLKGADSFGLLFMSSGFCLLIFYIIKIVRGDLNELRKIKLINNLRNSSSS